MVVHIAVDPSEIELISIPRDSYVPVKGYGRTKINAAFSYGGPSLLARTVEDLVDLRIDHVAVLDLEGFRKITRRWRRHGAGAGTSPENLEGDAALEYVRERESLPNGDFDRIQRQQNVLRALVTQDRQQRRTEQPDRDHPAGQLDHQSPGGRRELHEQHDPVPGVDSRGVDGPATSASSPFRRAGPRPSTAPAWCGSTRRRCGRCSRPWPGVSSSPGMPPTRWTSSPVPPT